MHSSRFQLVLMATLAVGLGFSLASSQAVGYPAGPAVSLGTNPIWNQGGQHSNYTPKHIITAPGDQDVVMTYLHVQNNSSNYVFFYLTSLYLFVSKLYHCTNFDFTSWYCSSFYYSRSMLY